MPAISQEQTRTGRCPQCGAALNWVRVPGRGLRGVCPVAVGEQARDYKARKFYFPQGSRHTGVIKVYYKEGK